MLAKAGHHVIAIGTSPNIYESNSALAQGGISYFGDGDTSDDLIRDILQAGSGLCFPPAVEQVATLGPKYLKELLIEQYHVPFETGSDGELMRTKEAAHSKARVLYYQDKTGEAIMKSLLGDISSEESLQVLTDHTAVDLITLSHHSKQLTDIYQCPTCIGAYVMNNRTQKVEAVLAKETILATGGCGELFLHTTNPPNSRGDGIAMAYRAAARVMNMEYIQFHPTAFYHPTEKRFLLTEALRGEGAVLLSSDMQPFMQRYDSKRELAPRDIVARSMYQEMLQHQMPHLWLDLSFKESDWIKERFPDIYNYLLKRGYDLTKEPVPVVPAAHYSCGGVAVDLKGQTTIKGLHAIGEVACTGVHGANRLASTSLLEGIVWGKRCADQLSKALKQNYEPFPEVEPWEMGSDPVDPALILQDWSTIQQTMWNYVGLIRDTHRLTRALKMLRELKWEIYSFYEKAKLTPELLGLRNGIQTALLVTQGAFQNRSSLGCHFRLN